MVQLSCISSGVLYIIIIYYIYTVSWEQDGSLIVMGKESGGGQISVKLVGLGGITSWW